MATGAQSITISASVGIAVGDVFTIAGYERRNPDRRWWQWCKPKFVANELAQFRVIDVVRGSLGIHPQALD